MRRILFVDDNENVQKMYAKLFKDEGYEVYQALDAEKATEFLITRPVDLVLLDIDMPKLDGKVMREVLDEYDKNIRIIVCSTYPLPEQKKRITNVNGYFDKSQGVDLLLMMIKKNIAQVPETYER